MAGFKLTKGNDTFDFDTAGAVKDAAGNAVGTWTTNNKNKIVLKKAAGAETPFDVVWKFNSNNHLCIFVDNKEVFNFNTVAGARPRFETRDAVLKVRPDTNNVFGFDLRGEWDMSDKHDLSFTVNGVASVIDGFITDDRSRFMFRFVNKKDLTQVSILGFVGQWSINKKAADAGTPSLDFTYKREDGSEDTFQLPKALVVRGANQVMYEYDKKGQKSRIQFQGFLTSSERGEISYVIDRQVSNSGEQQVAETTLAINARFQAKNPTTGAGELDFVVAKKDGSVPSQGATTLTLRGKYAGIVGSTHIQAGFEFEQKRQGNTITRTIGFDGSLSWDGGTTITWTFAKDTAAKTTSFNIAITDIKLGPARGDFKLNLVSADGKVAGVYALFGFSF